MAHHAERLPRHVAVIMDGNGRWAARQGRPRTMGHKAGAETLERIIEHIATSPSLSFITAFTAWGFSITNNDRNPIEVKMINEEAIRFAERLGPKLQAHGIRTRTVGNLADARVPKRLRDAIYELEDMTKRCNKLMLQIAWNYSGADEIARAQDCGFDINKLYTVMFDARDVPAMDVVIRTGVDNELGLVVRPGDFFPLLSQGAVWDPQQQMWPDTTGKHIEQACAKWRAEEHLNGGQRPTLISATG